MFGKPISVLSITDVTKCYDSEFTELGDVYVNDEGNAYRVVKFGEALSAGDVVAFSNEDRTEVTKAGTYGFAGVVLGDVEADTYGVVQFKGVVGAAVTNGTAVGNALMPDGNGALTARAAAGDELRGIALETNASGANAVKSVELI